MNGKHTLPADIERTSMAIITQELAAAGIELPPQHAAVVKRVIHTTAAFDYAQSLCFTPDAVARGVAALRQGVSIVTDTNMAKAGVSKPSLAKLGGTVACFMADGDVARAAQENGTTRADAAMEKAAREYPGAVLAVGNAPTALLRLEALIADGLRPALVVAVPVGFVNVVESKERIFAACRAADVPAIAAMGRKGGSNAVRIFAEQVDAARERVDIVLKLRALPVGDGPERPDALTPDGKLFERLMLPRDGDLARTGMVARIGDHGHELRLVELGLDDDILTLLYARADLGNEAGIGAQNGFLHVTSPLFRGVPAA